VVLSHRAGVDEKNPLKEHQVGKHLLPTVVGCLYVFIGDEIPSSDYKGAGASNQSNQSKQIMID
jgi:hypothetical protein